MKLKDDFFTVVGRTELDGQQQEITVRLHPEHFIYEAHFPGNPVTPGVCIIRMVQELAEERVGKKLFLQTVAKAKFLNVLSPSEHEEAHIALSVIPTEEQAYKVVAVVSDKDLVFAQLSLVLQ